MKSKRMILWVLIATGLLVITGCGGGTQAPVTDPADTSASWPGWFNHPPKDPSVQIAKATATSQDAQFAVDKAELDAQGRLATQVNAQLKTLMTRFLEEVGSGSDAQLLDKTTRATKRTADEALVGARVREQMTQREAGVWRAFILVEVPVVSTQKALLGEISKDEEMYTRFRESQAFQALEKTVGQ